MKPASDRDAGIDQISEFLCLERENGTRIAHYSRRAEVMHIHSNSMNFNALDSYSVIEQKAAAQRAADVRKKLMQNAQNINGELTPEANLMVDRWTDTQQSLIQDPYKTPEPPK